MTLTLYYLDNSRAFRVLWTAYELGIGDEVQVKTFARMGGKRAVPEMSKQSGFSLGKSPFLIDSSEEGEEIQVFESVACIEYLIERYGREEQGELLPARGNWNDRARVASFLSFCETPFTHALPIVYSQWFMPKGNDDLLETLTGSMAVNVQKDLDFYEETIRANKERYGPERGLFLANGKFSAADIANAFSAEYVLAKEIGTKGRQWPSVEAWLKNIEGRPAYRATKKAAGLHGFTLLDRDG